MTYLQSDLAANAANERDRESSAIVAKMARDAYRDHLADMATIERQTMARALQRDEQPKGE